MTEDDTTVDWDAEPERPAKKKTRRRHIKGDMEGKSRKVMLYMDEGMCRYLAEVGEGNMSGGVRTLIAEREDFARHGSNESPLGRSLMSRKRAVHVSLTVPLISWLRRFGGGNISQGVELITKRAIKLTGATDPGAMSPAERRFRRS